MARFLPASRSSRSGGRMPEAPGVTSPNSAAPSAFGAREHVLDRRVVLRAALRVAVLHDDEPLDGQLAALRIHRQRLAERNGLAADCAALFDDHAPSVP